MKKAIVIAAIVLGFAGVLCVAKAWTPRRIDPKIKSSTPTPTV